MKKLLHFILLIAFFIILANYTVFAKRRPPRPLKHKKVNRLKKHHRNKIIHNHIMKKRKYYKKHDLNNDGVVNHLDKLVWINTHPVIQETIVITQEEENLLSDIDINGDGTIDQGEIDAWLDSYDSNNDGTITEEELNQ